MLLKSMTSYGDNVETLNDWRQAPTRFLGKSQFSIFFEPCDFYGEVSYIKTAYVKSVPKVNNKNTSLAWTEVLQFY